MLLRSVVVSDFNSAVVGLFWTRILAVLLEMVQTVMFEAIHIFFRFYLVFLAPVFYVHVFLRCKKEIIKCPGEFFVANH